VAGTRSLLGLRTFDALSDVNFRWFFAAQFGTFAAMNMQIFARGWLVYELTGSYEKLGIATAANGAVGLFLAPLGGALADRVRQKKAVVQVAQAVNAVNALAITALIALGSLEFVHLVIAALLQGSVMSLMMPSRQALTPEVVGMDRLMNAIALNTSGMNTARLLMPGIAGFMVGVLGGGEGNIAPAQYAYGAMALLYAGSVFMLFRVHVADRAPAPRPVLVELEAGQVPVTRGPALGMLPALVGMVFGEIREGLVYVVRTPVIRMLLCWNFLMVFFGMAYFMILPGFVKDVLDVGPEGLGALQSISGVGSLVGSLVIASLPQRHRGLLLLASAGVIAVGVVGLAASNAVAMAGVALVVIGVGQAGRMSLSNVLIQTYVDDAFRGRVMSIYMLEFSLMNVTIYLVGLLADRIGVEYTVGLSGLGMLALALGLYVFAPTYRNLQ